MSILFLNWIMWILETCTEDDSCRLDENKYLSPEEDRFSRQPPSQMAILTRKEHFLPGSHWIQSHSHNQMATKRLHGHQPKAVDEDFDVVWNYSSLQNSLVSTGGNLCNLVTSIYCFCCNRRASTQYWFATKNMEETDFVQVS